MRRHITTKTTAIAAALLASTSLALAQDGEGPAPGNQMTEDAAVPADRATHYAELGDGGAWFRADPQNNTLEWTVEFSNVDATSVGIACGMGDEDGMADHEASADDEDAMVDDEGAMADDEASADDEDAMVDDEGAMADDEVSADDETPAGHDPAMDAEGDHEMMSFALDLGGDESPVEGSAADIDQATFEAFMGGHCEVVIELDDGDSLTGQIDAVGAAG